MSITFRLEVHGTVPADELFNVYFPVPGVGQPGANFCAPLMGQSCNTPSGQLSLVFQEAEAQETVPYQVTLYHEDGQKVATVASGTVSLDADHTILVSYTF